MSTSVAQSVVCVSPDRYSRRITLSQWFDKHLVTLNVASLFLISLLVLSYIVQVNVTITKGYQLRDLETQLHDLALMNQQIEQGARQAQSLQHVSHAVKMLGFEKAEMPAYIQAGDPSFALAE